MNNITKFIIDGTDINARLDTFLANVLENVSRSKIQNKIKLKEVFVNDKPSKPAQTLKQDDVITYDSSIFDEVKIMPENIALETVFETDDFVIVNKPSGMLTHPTSAQKTGTLVNALLFKYGANLSDINGEFRKGIIHRLDKNTSGLLLVAKNNRAHETLAQLIKNRAVEKRYRAVVRGVLTEDMIINEPIGRSKSNPTKMAVVADGKPSLTEVFVIETFRESTYIDINLKTGRTHQIRVHLSHVGHPVFNDTLYGFGKHKIRTEEQVLQSYKLRFINPFDNKQVDVEIEPDEKINKVLEYLKQKENV